MPDLEHYEGPHADQGLPKVIHPPPISVNKGRKAESTDTKEQKKNGGNRKSKRNKKRSSDTKKPSISKTAQFRGLKPVNEKGEVLGRRICSGCNMIKGHNSRTCKRRQLEAQMKGLVENDSAGKADGASSNATAIQQIRDMLDKLLATKPGGKNKHVAPKKR
jgi:hypothetical protein